MKLVPDWLLKNEEYTPLPDKDGFINKTILSLLRLLARVRTQSGYTVPLFPVNAVLKVACTFLLVLLLSLSRSYTFVFVVVTYLLLTVSMMPAKEMIKVLLVSILMALFTLLVLLPAAFYGNSYSVVMIPVKVLATIMAVNILSHSTRWDAIIGALKRFFLPDLFIFVLDITIKYIVMLGEFTLEMLYALKLRSVGRNTGKYTSLSGVAGTLFIKSREMAEDMHAAMECRGFTGEYRVYTKLKLTLYDLLYLVINAGLVFAFIYLSRG